MQIAIMANGDKNGKSGDPAATPPPSPLEQLQERLKAFLAANPISKVAAVRVPRVCNAIAAPWGDDSLVIELPPKCNDLIDALNNVVLPERYSALWHPKRKLLEVIYTTLPLRPDFADVKNRKFTFRHRDKEYICHFGPPSKELLEISANFLAVAQGTSTQHRNLGSFRGYILAQRNQPGFRKIPGGEPICFWIKGIEEWNENAVLDLARHLTFYMLYYDVRTAYILVHSPPTENIATQPQARFLEGKFPETIISRPIDDNLYHFWDAAMTGDPARRFLYNYQIIEYSAFSFIEENVARNIKRAISSPSAYDNIDLVAQQVLECIGESKIADVQKVEQLLLQVADPKQVWTQIARNIDFFKTKVEFDGGFSLPPLALEKWTAEDFAVNGMVALARSLRLIRNALSHGKEQRSMSVIAPTKGNFEKLQVWLPVIAVVANHVMIYRGVT